MRYIKMLHLLPGEILLLIIDTPEVYRGVSQVVALSDEFKLYIKSKFALHTHKKKYQKVLEEIGCIVHECINDKLSEYKYSSVIVKYLSDSNIGLIVSTDKCIMLESYNWLSVGCTGQLVTRITTSSKRISIMGSISPKISNKVCTEFTTNTIVAWFLN